MRRLCCLFVIVICTLLCSFAFADKTPKIDYSIDLALNKPIRATSAWDNYPIRNAIDGSVESYWESKGYPAEVIVDLQQQLSISCIRIRLNPDKAWSARTQTIEIQVSSDGSKYTKIVNKKKYSYNPKSANLVDITFKTVETRYIKIIFSSGSWKNGAQSAEIMVYGPLDESASAVDDVLADTSQDPVIPEDAKTYKGHAYKAFKKSMSWSEAEKKCEAEGGHLVTITSREEQKFIEQLIGNRGEYWIGLRRGADYSFVWVTGEKVKYTNWADGEPNDYWKTNYHGEDSVAIRPKWNDYHERNLESITGYICEWETETGVPAVQKKPEKKDVTEKAQNEPASGGNESSVTNMPSTINDDTVQTGINWGTVTLNDAEIAGEVLSAFLGNPVVINVAKGSPLDDINARYIYIGYQALGCDIGVAIRVSDTQMYFWSLDLTPENLVNAKLALDEKAPVCSVMLYEGNEIKDSAEYFKAFSSYITYESFKSDVDRILSSLSFGDMNAAAGSADPILACFPGLSWGMTKDEMLDTVGKDLFTELKTEMGTSVMASPEIFGETVPVLFVLSRDKLNMFSAVISQENYDQYLGVLTRVYGAPRQTTLMEALNWKFMPIKDDPSGDCYAWKTDKSLIILDGTSVQYLSLY